MVSALVHGAADALVSAVANVRVDHGGAQVAMSQEFLDLSDVVAVLEKMGGEGVALIPYAG